MVLKILREGIPKHIPIVIKENQGVFKINNPYESLSKYKSPDFYELVKDIGNVVFIKTSHNSHELIKNSILTATINGTCGIEAINFNKNCIIFSPNWYDSSEGIHLVRTPNDVSKVLEKISDQKNSDLSIHKEDFDRDLMIKFSRHDPYELDGSSRKELINAIKSALIKFSSLDDRKWEF